VPIYLRSPCFSSRDALYLSVLQPTATYLERSIPMVKLIALYKTPPDPKAFDEHYFGVHTPLVKQWPGLRKLEIAKITGAPIGEPKHYLIAEMYFDNAETMQRALASPEGKAAARDVMEFAGNLITMFYAEVNEEAATTTFQD